MRRYILGRIAVLPLSMLVVSFVTFAFLHLVPGDAVDALGGDNLSRDDLEQLRRQYGLDHSFLVQFGYWLANAVRGDLGASIRTHQPVLKEVLERLGPTVELALLAVIMSLILGVASGAIAVYWRDSLVDRLIMGLSTLGMSIPVYFAATLLVLGISLYFPEVGVVSYAPLSRGLLANVQSLFVPALALAIVAASTFVRYVRGAAEDILRNADFVRTARAKGASRSRILLRHIMPNTLIPLATAAGLQLAYLIGGTVVIESIFALPGLGQLLLAAIGQRDYPIVQGCVLFQAMTFVVVNLGVDLLYPMLDPRVRLATTR